MRIKAKGAVVVKETTLENVDMYYKKTSSQTNYQTRYLMANDKNYFISGVENLLHNFLEEYIYRHGVRALIGRWGTSKKDSVVGFEIQLPDLNEWENQAKQSIQNQLREYEEKFEQHLKKLSNT